MGVCRKKVSCRLISRDKEFFQEKKYLGKKSIYSGISIYYLFIAKGMGKFIRYMEGSLYRTPPIFWKTTKMFVISRSSK